MPEKYKIKKSQIHGKGVFSNCNINKNEIIGEGIIMKFGLVPYITPELGRLLNHSKNSNCKLKYYKNIYYIIAKKDIPTNTEITINYDDYEIPWFIQGSQPHYV